MHNIGIDLGTNNILIYVKNKGIVLNEANCALLDSNNNIISYGNEAKNMIDKVEEYRMVKPIVDGEIVEFDVLERILKKLIRKARVSLFKNNVLVCCPCINDDYRKLIKKIKARNIYMLDKSLVSAIGCGMDIFCPSCSMIVDVGAGITDISIISLGQIIRKNSIKIGGNTFDKKISDYVKTKKKVLISDNVSEEVKIDVYSLKSELKEKEITGRSVKTNEYVNKVITSDEIEKLLTDSVDKIINEVKSVLSDIPEELYSDIKEKGIILTGGGSLIKGLSDRLRKSTEIPVFLSENSLVNVVEGTGILLSNLNLVNN